MFLAQYHKSLGDYFGGDDKSNWPHTPLYADPMPLEHQFNDVMENILDIMSDGKLNGVSILDFAGYGNVLKRLEKQAKKVPTWPTEINFSINDRSKGNQTQMFTEYKDQLTRWER